MNCSRRQWMRAALGAAPAWQAAQASSSGGSVNVQDFGATGRGTGVETASIQSAIDACGRAGGGTVLFPSGVFLTGTLFLRDHVILHLSDRAVLRGSTNLEHYPVTVQRFRSYTDNYTDKSLIYAEGLSGVGIEGRGTIDGQGASFKGPYKVRPYLLRFIECRGVTVRDLRIENSPMWVQHYLACEEVRLTGLTVRSRVNTNNDGIDIDSCERVRISDCDISSGDDAICFKSTSARPCRDIAVTNCVASSACNAIKFGTESNGGFENIVVSNCALCDTRLSGIAVETVDGGTLDNVVLSNIGMRDVKGPIFVRLGDRGRPFREGDPKPAAGKLGNVLIQGVHATGAGRIGCSITGVPDAPVRGVTLRDVTIAFEGGGTAEDARREVPEQIAAYPEYQMFKTLPAYGLYCRHANDIRLNNLRLSYAAPDLRPALIAQDVDGFDIDGFAAQFERAAGQPIRLMNTRNVTFRACRDCGKGTT